MWTTFFEDCAVPPANITDPDPAAFAGAAGIFLMLAETAQAWASAGGPPQQLGPLSDLCPYIARRWGAGQYTALPDLPALGTLQGTFRDWAENRINFVATTQQIGGLLALSADL